MSERKVRLVANYIRGMNVREALDHLKSFQKAAAVPLFKLLNSACANAKHNASAQEHELFVQTITVDKAQGLKRWRARARGSAAPIHKHACHVTILLGTRQDAKKALKKEVSEKKVTKKQASNIKINSKSQTPKNNQSL